MQAIANAMVSLKPQALVWGVKRFTSKSSQERSLFSEPLHWRGLQGVSHRRHRKCDHFTQNPNNGAACMPIFVKTIADAIIIE
jgi:hypothetical protein